MEPSKRSTVRWLINGLTRGAWLALSEGPFKVDNHPFPPVLLSSLETRYERFPPASGSQLTARENTTTSLLQTLLGSSRVDILVARSRTGIEKEKERKKKWINKRHAEVVDQARTIPFHASKRDSFRGFSNVSFPPCGGSGIKRGLGKTEDSARSVYIDSSSRNRDSRWRDSY